MKIMKEKSLDYFESRGGAYTDSDVESLTQLLENTSQRGMDNTGLAILKERKRVIKGVLEDHIGFYKDNHNCVNAGTRYFEKYLRESLEGATQVYINACEEMLAGGKDE